MSDKPKRGIAVRAPERFEVFASPPTAHLSPVQQQATRGIAVPAPEHFEVIAPLPTFRLKLHLATAFGDSDLLELARAVGAAVAALSESEVALGGSGLKLVAQDAKHRVVTLTLAHAHAERLAQLAARLDSGELVLTASPLVAKCELVLPRAA